jgi:deoxycytidylate deaminase
VQRRRRKRPKVKRESSPAQETKPSIASLDTVFYPTQPELVIGLVSPIGTPIPHFVALLTQALKKREYGVVAIKLSRLAAYAAGSGGIFSLPNFERYDTLMTLGTKLRGDSYRNDILALFAAAQMSAERPASEPRHLSKVVFVVDQLKHPEEAFRLRSIYGRNFLLLGVAAPKPTRRANLKAFGMSGEQADQLIDRDADEAVKHGQRVNDTFHLADAFFAVESAQEEDRTNRQIERFLNLVFGTKLETPTRDEHGMFLAYAASLRSSSLARQVGASIVSEFSETLALGTNEVPCWPGGLYWGDEPHPDGTPRDARDIVIGYDESDRMKHKIVAEMLEVFLPDWGGMDQTQQARLTEVAVERLKETRIASLTEFTRAVHAEMEALSSAARVGVSVRGATLFSTTFPCHGCAKHIVAAGIRRVVYIEPYPKSLAPEMHKDSIRVTSEEGPASDQDDRVAFDTFFGIAPSRFTEFFGRLSVLGKRLEAKDDKGATKKEGIGLRVPFSPFDYLVRESLAARDLDKIREVIDAAKR